jgi:hypothetical protein
MIAEYAKLFDALKDNLNQPVLWLAIGALVIAEIHIKKVIDFWRFGLFHTIQCQPTQAIEIQNEKQLRSLYRKVFFLCIVLVFVTSALFWSVVKK